MKNKQNLEINLTFYLGDLYLENYKAVLKKIKEGLKS